MKLARALLAFSVCIILSMGVLLVSIFGPGLIQAPPSNSDQWESFKNGLVLISIFMFPAVVIGGVLAGLPALMLARYLGHSKSVVKLMVYGTLSAFVFGNLVTSMIGGFRESWDLRLPTAAAVSGLLSSAFWFIFVERFHEEI